MARRRAGAFAFVATPLFILVAVALGQTTPLSLRTASLQSGFIVTLAGTGTGGFSGDGGAAVDATVHSPASVAVDADGTVYFSDAANQRVRKIDPSGVITTVAGTGVASGTGDGGPATAATLNGPDGIAVDLNGNVYVADSGNNRVRRIDPSGTIDTAAGTGVDGYNGDGIQATLAELSDPTGVALDANGNLLITDYGNERVRLVDGEGVITTVAGDGSSGFSGDGGAAVDAQLHLPSGIAVNASGDVYVADNGNNRVRRIDTSGTIDTVAGTGVQGFGGDAGPATSADLSLGSPDGLAVDSQGNLLIADKGNHRIRRVDTTGTITTIAGTGVGGFNGDDIDATTASLFFPSGIAVDGHDNLVLSDESNHRIREIGGPPFAPEVTDQPSDTTVVAGDPVAFTSAAVGNPDPTVQWQVSTDGTSWSNITGATTTSLAFTSSPSDEGHLFRAVFTNVVGSSASQAATLTVQSTPDPPAIDSVVAGNGSATVAFTPGFDGESAITSYGVSCESSDGGASGADSGTASPVVVGGLTNGKTYSCTATATNAIGTSVASDPSVSFVPATVPDAPTAATVFNAFRSTWIAFVPGFDGGDHVTAFVALCPSSDGGATVIASGPGTPIALVGLTTGSTYTCTVTAANAVGSGPPSTPSNTFVAATVAGPPSAVNATVGNASASVSFTSPADTGASAITGYTAVCASDDGGTTKSATGAGSPIVVSSLSNGHRYACSVLARNGVGPGPSSSPSAPFVTPVPTYSVSVTARANPLAVGNRTTLDILVTPSFLPAKVRGTVNVFDGATLLGSATVRSGTARFRLPELGVGSHALTVSYLETPTSTPVVSDVLVQVVNPAATVTTLAERAPRRLGQAVTFTARVSRVAPARRVPVGTVAFYDGDTLLGTVPVTRHRATFTTSALGAGDHSITTVFTGVTDDLGSVSNSITQTITP